MCVCVWCVRVRECVRAVVWLTTVCTIVVQQTSFRCMSALVQLTAEMVGHSVFLWCSLFGYKELWYTVRALLHAAMVSSLVRAGSGLPQSVLQPL